MNRVLWLSVNPPVFDYRIAGNFRHIRILKIRTARKDDVERDAQNNFTVICFAYTSLET